MTTAILKAQNPSIPMESWVLLRVDKIIKRSVLLTFTMNSEGFTALSNKGNSLTICMDEVRVYTQAKEVSW